MVVQIATGTLVIAFVGDGFLPCDREGAALPEDEKPQARAARGEAFAMRFALKDGTARWGAVTISALRDDAGAFAGALAHVQDITAQKEAEAAVRENEARLAALVEQLPVALYRQEPGAAGAFHYVSPLFEQRSGLRQSDLPRSLLGGQRNQLPTNVHQTFVYGNKFWREDGERVLQFVEEVICMTLLTVHPVGMPLSQVLNIYTP